MKRGFFFQARRSGFLQGLTMVLFSGAMGLVTLSGAVVRILLHFGMLQNSESGFENFEAWIRQWHVDYKRITVFFADAQLVAGDVIYERNFYVWIGLLILVLLLAMFFYLMLSAGYHHAQEEPCLRGIEKLPYDICILVFGACFLFGGMLFFEWMYVAYTLTSILFGILAGVMGLVFLLMSFVRITAAQIRTGTLFSGTVIISTLRTIWFFVKKIPSVWRATLLWFVVLAVCYFVLVLTGPYFDSYYYYDNEIYMTYGIWFVMFLLLFAAGVWLFVQMDMVRKKAQRLAEGNWEAEQVEQKDAVPKKKIRNLPRKPILSFFRKCLEDLDRISDGMEIVVEEKMKSERFQTELITNVSHDIKTPLTSIINYLDFLAKEEKKEERNAELVREYMEVLDRQSVRLKKLIEDLIEASKASTGSLKVEKEPCELGIFLQQIAGEYEERLEKAHLTLQLTLPPDQVFVEADGRHLWRVIDNLLQNVCKYAMAGSRVYLQLEVNAEQAMIVMKNISATELNIPAAELMERFVCGDRSRHTEGSGLGLSIAQSLTELQGGKFKIEIDGDLFKTIIQFPIKVPTGEDFLEETPLNLTPLEVDSSQSSEKR